MKVAEFYEVKSPTVAEVAAKLASTGFAVVRDITSGEFEGIVDSIASRRSHRDSDANGVTDIQAILDDESGSGYAGFTRLPMPPHSDGSAQNNPPELLSMWCAQAASSGGDSLLVDVAEMLKMLMIDHPEAITAIRDVEVTMGSPSLFRGTLLRRINHSRWSFRFRDDGLADYSHLGNDVEHLRAAILDATFRVALGEGDAYFLNNHRWLHGREGFEGSRSMMRILGDYREGTFEAVLHPGFEVEGLISTMEIAC